MTASPRAFALALLAATAPAIRAADDAGVAFFEKQVRPILVERCYECHSEDKKVKGGLRLDLREGWAKGGDTGPAIVPGKPEESLLLTAVHWKDRDLEMPPKKKLPAAEIAALEEWVRLGAPDPRDATTAKKQPGLSIADGRKFWSYTALSKPAVPAVKDAAWPRTDIDRFILAKLEAQGIAPAPDAAPAVLARRLYLTLTGLPPTPAQVDAFLDGSRRSPETPPTYEQLTETLLASPRFGEAWGRHWLDVARFAESSGGGRTLLFKDAWRFRDYVIDAFNADVPFDRFIREQLAGDLLPAATPADTRRQLTATAFLALGPTNYEEQDKQQLRFDVIDEQLETLGRAFLGQTISCARCHDHKFDPIPQRDYYAMAGILASTQTLLNYKDNVARWISSPLPADGPNEAALREHETKLAALEKEVATAKTALTELSKSLSQSTAQPGTAIAPGDLPGIVIDDSQARVVGFWKHSRHVRTFIGEGYLSDDNTGKGEKTVTFTPTIPQTARYQVRLAYSPLEGRATNVRVNILHADGEDTVYVDESQTPPIDGRFISLGKFRFEKDGAGYVLISNEGTKGYVTVDALQLLPEGAETEENAKDSPDRAAAAKLVKQLEGKLKKLAKDGPVRETAMAVHDALDDLGGTAIRVRGIEKQRGEKVPRGFLQVARRDQPAVPDTASGRVQLAEWIASPDHPLTARVFVNRVWTWLFGAGLVRTVDNFGTTGEKPTHPELLDHLATRFIAEGWSVKKLVREIVLSRTWQMSVVENPNFSDPDNRLLAHANRRRLDAEQIRDTILSVSGQLEQKLGGLNIGGAGEIDANDFSAQNTEYGYVFADKRRSVYTPAFRNKRLELFEAFDFGDINQSFGQRNVSTVAPQALYLLNHPFVIEQSSLAADRALASSASDDERLTDAFRTTLARPPTAKERTACARRLASAGTDEAARREAWSEVYHSLFACLDFRYID